MKRLIFILLATLLVGCGKAITQPMEFSPALFQFRIDALAAGRSDLDPFSVEIQYADAKAPKHVAAYCSGGTIYVNKTLYNQLDSTMQTLTFYHELGHCLLGLQHSANPSDIMYPSNIDESVWLSGGASAALGRFFQ